MRRKKAVAPPQPRIAAGALDLLIEARRFAQRSRSDPWIFAVRIADLRGAGCTDNALRFLVIRRYVEHAVQIASRSKRRFKKRIGLSLSERSCFILTEMGDACAPELSDRSASGRKASSKRRPRFDGRCLRIGDVTVLELHKPAPNVRLVLAAFEEQRWAQDVDDPLPPVHDKDSKQRLRQTISNLNKRMAKPLIHFCGDGTGQRIGWQWKSFATAL